ncbi:hypothetical protein RHGRI_030081 [Rhododendron griersonianum]|uniref:Uncharacterized protein n=1 Tax=Rhododendron griersonianum TaxID=479676 RepID=A0AAV6ILQ4_9ERIC|nr:hypothetical protein RHGRI_030081 [Rhododendron griersonianum]
MILALHFCLASIESIQRVCEIGKCLWAPRRINYARKLTSNWEALRNKASELGIKTLLTIEFERQKTLTKECDDWRKKVAEMENKVETIKQEFNVEKKCVMGLCPDIFRRTKLGERVINMINDIDLLIEKSKFEMDFSLIHHQLELG